MKRILFGAIIFLLVPTSAYSAKELPEYRTFFGVDVIRMETELSYLNGTENYEYDGLRIRYGLESDKGGSAGIEFIPVLSDEQIDPFGSPFELELGPSLGVYFTVGKPVYFRLGISVSNSEYTDVNSGVSDSDTLTVIDVGLGFNFALSQDITFYGEYTRRISSEAEYTTFFTEDIETESEVIALGLNYKFL